MKTTALAIVLATMTAVTGRAQTEPRRLGDGPGRPVKMEDNARERREKLEAQRAEAEARAEARKAELEKQRAEWEQRRAEAEKQRAELEARRAEWEAKRADLERVKGEVPRADWEARKAEIEARRAEFEKQRGDIEAKKAEMEKRREEMDAKRAELEKRRAEEKARYEEERRKLEERAEAYVDRRQDNQEKRIQHGIRKGYLTPEETAALRSQQNSIAALEETLKADGRLTRTEFAQLREALDAASRTIWAEKHDTEGRQMPVYRLGKNVFARDSLTAQLSDPDLSREAARALLADFRRLLHLRDRLANEDLTEEQRAELQAAYETLLGTYFRVG